MGAEVKALALYALLIACSTEPDEDLTFADPNCGGAYLAIPGEPCRTGYVFMVFDQVASCYCATVRQAKQANQVRK